jgi:hypothetical protein
LLGPLLVLALPLVGLVEEHRHEPEGTAGEGGAAADDQRHLDLARQRRSVMSALPAAHEHGIAEKATRWRTSS